MARWPDTTAGVHPGVADREVPVQFTQVLDHLLLDAEAQLETRGWDQPAVLIELRCSEEVGGLALTLEPLALLAGHPVCDLLRRRPTLGPEAVGAILVTEGWGPHEQDPAGRVEHRLAHLCLRDGTEQVVRRVRGEAAEVLDGRPTGWTTELLHRCVGRPSASDPPPASFPRELVLAWQVYTAVWAQSSDAGLPAPADAAAWGSFTVPGQPPVPGGPEFREPWWTPVEAALAGDALDVGALAGAFRASFAAGRTPLAFAAPLVRGEDLVVMTPPLAAWCDDALLVAFCDAATPDVAELTAMLTAACGPAWGASLAAYAQRQPGLR